MSITMKAAVTLVLIFTFMQATSTINAQPQLLPSTQVYLGRIDDPQKGRFRRCRMDTFGHIFGLCTYPCCMLFYRTGYDGKSPVYQKKKKKKKSVTFFFNSMYIPQGVWYGLNNCIGAHAASSPENTQKRI
ncbi:unnamed protein product [Malus baccata var. baccata]